MEIPGGPITPASPQRLLAPNANNAGPQTRKYSLLATGVNKDGHTSLLAAIGATLPAATWQRCRTHCAANLMPATPKYS